MYGYERSCSCRGVLGYPCAVADTDVSIATFRQYLLGLNAKTTALRYSTYASIFLELMHANGFERFDALPPGLLSDFASMLSREGRSPATVRVQVFAAKKYLDWVRSRGVPVTDQGRPELPKKHLRLKECLPQSQFSLYFRQADMDLREPIRTAIMLLPCCGLRAQEMVTLRLKDIRRVTVTLADGKKKHTLALCVKGKGGKERNVPLMEEGVEILTGYLAGWRRRTQGPWLFPKVINKRGRKHLSGKKPVSDRYLRLALQQLREPLGMDFTPHTLRRTYITMLYRKGVGLPTIANIAGHTSVQTTVDHYIVMDANDNVSALHNAGSSLTEDRRR